MADTSRKPAKIVVLGFRGVGKSACVIRFVREHFVSRYLPTLNTSFKKVVKHGGLDYELEITDTAGQDEYSEFGLQNAIGVNGYVFLYSVADVRSFDVVKKLHTKLMVGLGVGENVPVMLVGNKSDFGLQRRQVTYEEGKALADEWNCKFIETSAKENENVEKMFHMLLSSIAQSEEHVEKDPSMWNCLSQNGGCFDSKRLFKIFVFLSMIICVGQSLMGAMWSKEKGKQDFSVGLIALGLFTFVASMIGFAGLGKCSRSILTFYGVMTLISSLVNVGLLGYCGQQSWCTPIDIVVLFMAALVQLFATMYSCSLRGTIEVVDDTAYYRYTDVV
eukprot:TRINITY_DN11846_c0_g1_i1.p1 TRINITY_DN11846_c0_g1~~TRINITY_DN11846_c0_g1_i1.p1  ORF type:complete len:333 (+),score=86.44 TRINITY_DN11846_c0_g1_i1:47-1045(+)